MLSVSESLVSFDFGCWGREPLLERACPFGGVHAPVGEGAPLWVRARPFGNGHVHFDLVGEKGRAPVAEGGPLEKGSFKVSQ